MAPRPKASQRRPVHKMIHKKVSDFLKRREHRSFRLTRRRDYVVHTPLPGYVRFTLSVHRTIWTNKRVFLPLGVLYVLLNILLVGVFSQDMYNVLSTELSSVSSEYSVGGLGTVQGAWAMLSTIMTGGLSESQTGTQQTFSVLLGLLLWLSTVWALRNILSGSTIRARDALYNAGSPVVSTFMLVLIGFLQIIPCTLVLLAYLAASSSGLLELPISIALSWLTIGLSALLTLYWLGSTLMALVIVTLPGMYPWASIRAASDLVLGRRLIIMYRVIWMLVCIAIVWVAVMIAGIVLTNWLTGMWGWLASVPVIPVAIVIMNTLTMIYGATYVYMLYRGIVDGLDNE